MRAGLCRSKRTRESCEMEKRSVDGSELRCMCSWRRQVRDSLRARRGKGWVGLDCSIWNFRRASLDRGVACSRLVAEAVKGVVVQSARVLRGGGRGESRAVSGRRASGGFSSAPFPRYSSRSRRRRERSLRQFGVSKLCSISTSARLFRCHGRRLSRLRAASLPRRRRLGLPACALCRRKGKRVG